MKIMSTIRREQFSSDANRFGNIPYQDEEFSTIKKTLQRQLGPEFTSQRPGPAGTGKITYIEGWKTINLANEIFGFNGWSSSIIDITVDFVDVSPDKRVSLGLSVIVRVTLKDGTYHEDIGYGSIENSKSKATAFEKAKKEATTDALKRALRTFGNVLGNCLYDKKYVRNVQKVSTPMVPFNSNELYRHWEMSTDTANASVNRPLSPQKKKSFSPVTRKKSLSTAQTGQENISNNVAQPVRQMLKTQAASLRQDSTSTPLQPRPPSAPQAPVPTTNSVPPLAITPATACLSHQTSSQSEYGVEDKDDDMFVSIAEVFEDDRGLFTETPRFAEHEFDHIDLPIQEPDIKLSSGSSDTNSGIKDVQTTFANASSLANISRSPSPSTKLDIVTTTGCAQKSNSLISEQILPLDTASKLAKFRAPPAVSSGVNLFQVGNGQQHPPPVSKTYPKRSAELEPVVASEVPPVDLSDPKAKRSKT
ncbi:uncharacterized protein VTP21DRAFT_6081 [Calcarisporiella thermophila]|uniref:uncharacterized protein n=1 Tax=Calcarisporiella thermophila TaxID=911321 RepID=UPI0037433F07